MRLSVSSYSFEAIPLEGTLAIAHAMGFRLVDIGGFHARGLCNFEPDEVGADPTTHADSLRTLLDKYELAANDFFVQYGSNPGERSMNDPDPAVLTKNLESFPGILRFCKLIGARSVTMLPGVDHTSRSLDHNLDIAATNLRQFVALTGEQGLTLCYEPHMSSVTPTPELALALVEHVPGLKITLDYSHFLLQYIPIDRAHRLIPHTGHVHVRQARPGKLQTRHVEGTLDFIDIAHRLRNAGYQGCMSLEYVCADWYDANQIDTLAETMFTKNVLLSHVSL